VHPGAAQRRLEKGAGQQHTNSLSFQCVVLLLLKTHQALLLDARPLLMYYSPSLLLLLLEGWAFWQRHRAMEEC
jgi:hypothetical protein